MRIIKRGTLPETVEKEVTCYKCHTEFAYTQKDVQSDPRNETYVECPVCKSFIDDSVGKPVKK